MNNYLLLLHGYTQNGEIMKKKIKKLLTATFLENFIVISPNGCYKITENSYGWWYLESPEMFSKNHVYKNYDLAIKTVQEHLENLKEEDNLYIISFSQGSVLLEIMLLHNCFKVIPRKVILMSSSCIMDMNLHKEYKISTESLVILGKKEGIFGITEENFKKNTFLDNYTIKIHEQGHVISSKKEIKKSVKEFLQI